MIKGLTHVAVRVQDIDKSIAFYTEGLGLTERFRLTNDQNEVMLVYIEIAPGQFIELFPGAVGPCTQVSCSGLVHIYLEVEDIHKAHKELSSCGVKVGEPLYAADNTWQFWTTDPDGNPIEFHQFTPESMQLSGE